MNTADDTLLSRQFSPEDWGRDPRRAPPIPEGATLLLDAPGRVVRREGHEGGIDYRSHYLRLIKSEFDGLQILVRHGAGDETISLAWNARPLVDAITAIPDDDARYVALYVLYQTDSRARTAARDETAARYKQAFVDGRIKKSRPKQGRVRVWIEDPAPQAQAA